MRCGAGKVAVAVHLHDGDGLLSHDDVESRGLTDVGTVIASGDVRYPAGSVVVMRQRYGKYVSHLRSSGYVYGMVRLLGDAGKNGVQDLYDAGECIVCEVDGLRVKPKGGRLFVKRDAIINSYGGLVLPDTVGNRSGMATVLESDSDEFPIGARICAHAGSYERYDLPQDIGEAYGCDAADLAFIHGGSVYYLDET